MSFMTYIDTAHGSVIPEHCSMALQTRTVCLEERVFLLYTNYRYIDILNTKHIDKKSDTCIHRSRVAPHRSRVVLHSTRHNASEEPKEVRKQYIFLVAFGRERKNARR